MQQALKEKGYEQWGETSRQHSMGNIIQEAADRRSVLRTQKNASPKLGVEKRLAGVRRGEEEQ